MCHASPTGPGLRLIPLMGGLVLTSVVSGRVISRTGHYRAFPIAGTATMTVGLLLLSRLDVGTSSIAADAYLLVLGLGLRWMLADHTAQRVPEVQQLLEQLCVELSSQRP